MVAVVGNADAGKAVKLLKAAGVPAWRIGRIARRRKNGPQVIIV